MRTLIHNIACIFGIERQGRTRLCGEEMGRMETLEDAWLLVEDGRIAAFGSASEGMPEDVGRRVEARGGMLFPSFCDSHTHLVYAGSREQEFLDKINGLSYEEIARRGRRHTQLRRQAARGIGRRTLRHGDGARAGDCRNGHRLRGDQERLRPFDRRRAENAARDKAHTRKCTAGSQGHLPRGARCRAGISRAPGRICRPRMPRDAARCSPGGSGRLHRRILRRGLLHGGRDRAHHRRRAEIRPACEDSRQRAGRFGRSAGRSALRCPLGRPPRKQRSGRD